MVAEFFSKTIFSNSLQQLYFCPLACFLPSEESTRSKECRTFAGTKPSYLFDQVNKWFPLLDFESSREIKEESQTSWDSPTITILWIRDPSRRESFSVFFSESHE